MRPLNVFVVFIFLICQSVLAKPFVESFEQSSAVKVILVFESTVAKRAELGEISGSIELRKALMLENKQNLNDLISRFSWLVKKEIKPLWILNSLTLTLNKDELERALKLPNLKAVFAADKPIKAQRFFESNELNFDTQMTYGLNKLNIPKVREIYPHLLGTGVRVGILDTGIDPRHRDLKGRMHIFKNFSPAKSDEPADGFNHGTHVAGTVAGGAQSGKAIGVAPEANLLIGRIFDRNGNSTRQMILESMQWMADPDGNPETDDQARIVNNSWSDDEPYDDRTPEDEPFCHIISMWLRMNMVPVFSAGNTGPSDGSINLPAGCPGAFAVGATESSDRSPHFSSTGPAVWKNMQIMKPEVSAPGFKIYSARSGGGYTKMSGNSMSSPHVSGAFAILIQAHPNAKVDRIIDAMKRGSKDLGAPGQDKIFGWGRIDVFKSLQLLQ